MTRFMKPTLTGLVVAVAVALIVFKYFDYLANPWTRNGQVQANVIQIAPRVTGPIDQLPIEDNQPVKAGDLLFEIDPRTFIAQYDHARANYDETIDALQALDQEVAAARATVSQLEADVAQAVSHVKAVEARLAEARTNLERFRDLLEKGDTSQLTFDARQRSYLVEAAEKQQADAALMSARSALLRSKADLAVAIANRGLSGDDNAKLRAARAALEEAELNVSFTRPRAPVDGYVTNLSLWQGSQATANKPALALVQDGSFWVNAFFRETEIGPMQKGDRAIVTLMSYPDTPIEAEVESVAWGIAQSDGSTGEDLLPNVNPTFEWIRLAQRVPVRIRLKSVPETVELRVGTTASVLVMTGNDSR